MAISSTQQALQNDPWQSGEPLMTQFQWQPVPGSLAAGGRAWGTQLTKVPVGGVQTEDALQAAMGDRNVALQKIGDMEKTRQQGMNVALGAPGRATDLRTEAKTQREALGARTEEGLGKGREAIAGAQAQADELGPAADARRADALEEAKQFRNANLLDAETRQTEALAQFQDDTASAIEMQRTGAMRQFASSRDDIINRAAQQGLSPDSPEVQAQLSRAKMGTFQQLGSMAMQGQLAYNDARSKLNTAYDDFGLRARSFSDQLSSSVRLEEDKYAGLTQQQAVQFSTQLAEMTSSLEMGAVQEHRVQEQNKAQLLLAADQFELAGSNTIADYMRNYQMAMAPLAPILSVAASMNEDAIGATNRSIAAVSSGVGVRQSNASPLLTQRQGTPEGGARGLAQKGPVAQPGAAASPIYPSDAHPYQGDVKPPWQ